MRVRIAAFGVPRGIPSGDVLPQHEAQGPAAHIPNHLHRSHFVSAEGENDDGTLSHRTKAVYCLFVSCLKGSLRERFVAIFHFNSVLGPVCSTFTIHIRHYFAIVC